MTDAQQRGMRPAPLTRFRRGTTAEWEYANPTLQKGEPGYDTEAGVLKVGDGTTAWNELEGIIGSGDGEGSGGSSNPQGVTFNIYPNQQTGNFPLDNNDYWAEDYSISAGDRAGDQELIADIGTGDGFGPYNNYIVINEGGVYLVALQGFFRTYSDAGAEDGGHPSNISFILETYSEAGVIVPPSPGWGEMYMMYMDRGEAGNWFSDYRDLTKVYAFQFEAGDQISLHTNGYIQNQSEEENGTYDFSVALNLTPISVSVEDGGGEGGGGGESGLFTFDEEDSVTVSNYPLAMDDLPIFYRQSGDINHSMRYGYTTKYGIDGPLFNGFGGVGFSVGAAEDDEDVLGLYIRQGGEIEVPSLSEDGMTGYNIVRSDLDGVLSTSKVQDLGLIEVVYSPSEEELIFSYETTNGQESWSLTGNVDVVNYSWASWNEFSESISINRPGLYSVYCTISGDIETGPVDVTFPINGVFADMFWSQKDHGSQTTMSFAAWQTIGFYTGENSPDLVDASHVTGNNVVVTYRVSPLLLLPENISNDS